VVTYTLLGSNGGSAIGQATFTVTNVNDTPTAIADAVTVLSGAQNPSINVLANDTDPDNADVLRITSITQPPTGSGTLAIATDGRTINYTPPSNTFSGQYTFSYTITDSANATATASVTVDVQPFTPRDISGEVRFAGGNSYRVGKLPVKLTGVDMNNGAVTQNVITGIDGSYRFEDIAPGLYNLTIDPLPFTNDVGQTIALQSLTTEGDKTANLEVSGSLLSQHVDIRDFLGSNFRKSLTAVVRQDGSPIWVAPRGDWANLTNIQFQLDTNQLTLTGANATASNLTANVRFTNNLMTRYTAGDQQLIKLRGASTKFNLAAPTTTSPTTPSTTPSGSSGTSTASGEGEGNSAAETGSAILSVPAAASSASSLSSAGVAGSQIITAASNGATSSSPTPAINSAQAVGNSVSSVMRALLGSSKRQRGLQTSLDAPNETNG
jgi:hypothetical protein